MPVASRRGSSSGSSDCTVCDPREAEYRSASSALKTEEFNEGKVKGTYETWLTGRTLGAGTFARVRLAKGLKSGRIVSCFLSLSCFSSAQF